jgi:DNA-binding CsgD family transcriptional regulator
MSLGGFSNSGLLVYYPTPWLAPLACCGTVIAIAILFRKSFTQCNVTLLISLSAIFSLVGLLFLLICHLLQSVAAITVLATLSRILLCIVIGILMQLWSLCFSATGAKDSIGVVCVSVLLSAALFLLLVSLPSAIAGIFFYLFPVFSASCLFLIKNDNITEILSEKSARPSQWRWFWIIRIVYGLTMGLVIGLSASQYRTTFISELAQGISAVIGLTLLVLIIISYVSRRFTSIEIYWLPSIPLVGVALFFSMLIKSDSGVLLPLAIISASLCFIVLSSVQISNFRMLFGVAATAIAFSEKAIVYANWTLGLVIGTFASERFCSYSIRADTLTWLFTGALIVGTVFVLSRYTLTLKEMDYFKKEPQKIHDILMTRCHDLAVAHNLTPREEEVLCLLAAGRSGPYITRELVISDGTFRTHSHHIYKKLGIHKNQELLDLIARDDLMPLNNSRPPPPPLTNHRCVGSRSANLRGTVASSPQPPIPKKCRIFDSRSAASPG